eukprot:g27260.t1
MSMSSLKQYGHLIMSEWTLDSFFASPPTSVTHCPNKALLLVLPKNGQAALVTDSCHYLCEDRSKSGQTIETQMKSHTVAGAVLAGLRDAYTSLPVSVVQGEDMPPVKPLQESTETSTTSAETWVLFIQRAIFAFAVMALGLSFAVGFLATWRGPRK